jgi:phosphate transport system substrate-binding protein
MQTMKNSTKNLIKTSAVAIVIAFTAGCNNNSSDSKSNEASDKTATKPAQANVITGAGSTFIYPVMAKWTQKYAENTGVKVNYQAIGSGGGLKQLKAKTIDFAASDEPLRIQDLHKLKAMQFPMVMSGIVPVVHLHGIHNNQITLSGEILADIYQGKITKWNDLRIKKLNPEVELPNTPIITIHRADGSGTTFNFTYYLSQVSKSWKSKVGYDTVVAWPGRLSMGGKGNAGVAAQVQNVPNTIGYVEYAYAVANKMSAVKMINKANKTVEANLTSFASAANNAKWSADNGFYQLLTNQPGAASWPIVATTFILVPEANPKDKQKVAVNKASLKFFSWAFKNGNAMAKDLNYIVVPASAQKKIETSWKVPHHPLT